MVDEIYDRPRKQLRSANPNLNEIAEHIEDQARLLHEFGHTGEANNLIKWAGELRQRSSWPEK